MEQQSIREVAESVGTSADKVLESVRRLGMNFEPRYRELNEDSCIFAHDIIRVREDLGLLSDVEIELQRYKEREFRNESNRLVAGCVLAGAVGVWMIVDNWDHISGFLDGTDPYQGLTLPRLAGDLWGLVSRPVVWVALIVLGGLYALLEVAWRRKVEKKAPNERYR